MFTSSRQPESSFHLNEYYHLGEISFSVCANVFCRKSCLHNTNVYAMVGRYQVHLVCMSIFSLGIVDEKNSIDEMTLAYWLVKEKGEGVIFF